MSGFFGEWSRAADQTDPHRSRRGIAAGLMIAVLVTGLGGAHSPALTEETEATWTSSAHARGAGDAPVTAGTVQPLRDFQCAGGLLARHLQWSAPATGAPPNGYHLQVFRNNEAQLTTPIVLPGTQTSFRDWSRISALLTVLGTYRIEITAHGPGSWESQPSRANVQIALGALGAIVVSSCSVV